LNWQLEHFNVPVYPVPKTPTHVAPPKSLPSHFSVPSRTLLPQEAAQLLSVSILHPPLAGQQPSLFMQEVIELYEHALVEQRLVVQALLSLH
jgi:hypothetical protein